VQYNRALARCLQPIKEGRFLIGPQKEEKKRGVAMPILLNSNYQIKYFNTRHENVMMKIEGNVMIFPDKGDDDE